MGIVETDMAQNKADEALKLLQSESDKAPGRIDLLLSLANVAVRAGKYDFAIQTYDRMLVLTDKSLKAGDIYMRIGETYRRKGDANNAIDVFKDLVAKEPHHATYRYHLAMAYSQKGDRTKAMEQLKEALKYSPKSDEKEKIQQLITKLG